MAKRQDVTDVGVKPVFDMFDRRAERSRISPLAAEASRDGQHPANNNKEMDRRVVIVMIAVLSLCGVRFVIRPRSCSGCRTDPATALIRADH
jgi:hypothetical protein